MPTGCCPPGNNIFQKRGTLSILLLTRNIPCLHTAQRTCSRECPKLPESFAGIATNACIPFHGTAAPYAIPSEQPIYLQSFLTPEFPVESRTERDAPPPSKHHARDICISLIIAPAFAIGKSLRVTENLALSDPLTMTTSAESRWWTLGFQGVHWHKAPPPAGRLHDLAVGVLVRNSHWPTTTHRANAGLPASGNRVALRSQESHQALFVRLRRIDLNQGLRRQGTTCWSASAAVCRCGAAKSPPLLPVLDKGARSRSSFLGFPGASPATSN